VTFESGPNLCEPELKVWFKVQDSGRTKPKVRFMVLQNFARTETELYHHYYQHQIGGTAFVRTPDGFWIMLINLGSEQIRPLTDKCLHLECNQLLEAGKVESRLYTLKWGVLPVYSVSEYCHSKSIYHLLLIVFNTKRMVQIATLVITITTPCSMQHKETRYNRTMGVFPNTCTSPNNHLWNIPCVYILRHRWCSCSVYLQICKTLW